MYIHVHEFDSVKLNVKNTAFGIHMAVWANKTLTEVTEQVPSRRSLKSVSRRGLVRLMPEPGIEPGTFRSSV